MPVVWGIVEHSPIVTWFANFFVSEYCLSGDSKASFNSDNLSFVLQVYNSFFFFIKCLNVSKLCQRRSATCLSYIGAHRSTEAVLPEEKKSISDQLDRQLLNCLVCLCLNLQIKISFSFIFLFWKLFFKLFWLIF